MSRLPLSAAAILLSVVAGCGAVSTPPAVAPTAPEIAADTATTDAPSTTDDAATAEVAPLAIAAETPRKRVGDYVVHRFSGSFRRAPITLSQKIVAREPGVLVVDVTLDEGKTKQTLRVRMNESGGEKPIVSVAKLDKDIETPSTLAVYEAMLAKTSLTPDRNEDFVSAESVHVDVAGKPVACTKSTFRVRVGNKSALLHVLASESFAWGDLGGDITAKDGTVLYRAEIVDVGSSKASDAMATTEDF